MILDGKKAANELFIKLQEKIHILSLPPKMVAIQVGENPASSLYISIKRKKLQSLGLGFEHVQLPSTSSTKQVQEAIETANNSKLVQGILLQLPLPDHLNERTLLDTINPSKDIDCLTSHNLGLFFSGSSKVLPATPLGVLRLLEYYSIRLEGKNICVVGRSNLVGKPLALALTQKNATVTICHSKTENLKDHILSADIIISAIGNPLFFTKEYFNSNQILIDVGTSKGPEGSIVGDINFNEVKEYVHSITPVPGGVGPMTIYGLIENLITLSSNYN